MDAGYKIYAEIIKNRLDKEMEEKGLLSDTQMGFRKKRETIEAIYVVKKAMERKLERKGGELWCFTLI